MKLKIHPPALVLLSMLAITPISALSNPLDSDGPVVEAAFESALRNYVNDSEPEVGGWKAANDRVGQIGGWRTYLERAREPVNPRESESAQSRREKSATMNDTNRLED
ncbi:MAG: hypothetical protein ACRBC3_16070 [Burkholderiaceae bacterium]